MAMSEGAFSTYLDYDRTMREDLFDAITNISPFDTLLLRDLPKDKAKNTFVEWTTDSLITFQDNAQIEGFEASFTARPQRERLGNRTQVFGTPWKTTGSIEAADQAGIVGTEYTYQMQNAMREHGTDIEYALTKGSSASGDTATARKLHGARSWIISVSAIGSSVAAFEESVFNDLSEQIYTNGGRPEVFYASPKLKRVVAAYSTPNQRMLPRAEEGFLAAYVDVYQGEFGPVQIQMDRWLSYDHQTDYEVGLFIDRKYWRISVYRRTFSKELPANGDYRAGLLITELTLKALAEAANGKYLACSS